MIKSDWGELKKPAMNGLAISIVIDKTIPRMIDTIHAEFTYCFNSLFSCTRKMLIPVSVIISRSARNKEATPNIPNSTGESIRAKIAVRTNVINLVDPLRTAIQDIPLIAMLV